MKFFPFYVIALLVAITTSCTLNKTDYEAEISTNIIEYYQFKEVYSHTAGKYKVSVEALNGTFYKGYNEVHIKIIDLEKNQFIKDATVNFLPILTNLKGEKTSCPHQYKLDYKGNEAYYLGYSVFSNESTGSQNWKIYLDFKINGQDFSSISDALVKEQNNKNLNMKTFKGNDGKEYVIALIAPQKPKIAENKLIAGVYQYNRPLSPEGTFPDASQFSYSQVNGYTLLLDPRMPEPSMGNHSSINNQNLIQQADGFYHGIVNYTMTGNWTLNFIMLNEKGINVKGTQVSRDFTPGIEGVKSELFINILF